MNFWIILHHLFEIVHRMLKHRGNHQLVSSGFVFRILQAVRVGRLRQNRHGKTWTHQCKGSLQQERLWEVSKRQQAFYSATSERRKKKTRLTYDQDHFHLGTDHLEKQWVNVNYHLCSFPPPSNLGAILLSLNSQTNLTFCRDLQWTCKMSSKVHFIYKAQKYLL